MHLGYDMAAYMGIRALRELEVVSHNLANASTPGFKRELLNLWRLRNLEIPGEDRPAYLDVLSRDFSQGALQTTENETDLALEGRGFFKVEAPQGLRYTRNGCFHLTPDRRLVTAQGYSVLGKNGPITLDAIDQKFAVDEQGGIHLDNSLADRLAVVDFAHPQDLRPVGQNYFVPGPDAGEELEARDTRVLQGMVEASNVDPVAAAVSLITIQRSFESYLQVLDTFAASDRKVVEDLGHV
uniref:Flagellar hook basal-body protein n=1 Tax=Desulfobacca acetoxidans TaxID=60893 RepID=A0A7C3WRJ6_9BACT